ncbi:MAG: trypsin-like peptidase domain-containing protein, partial [Clostridium sp.]
MYNDNEDDRYPDGGDRREKQNSDQDINYTEGAYTDDRYYERKPDRSYIPEEPKHSKDSNNHKGSTAKRVAGIAAAGILFGCLAGGTMVGVNAIGGHFLQKNEAGTQIGESEMVLPINPGTTAATAIPVSIGNDVSAIVDKAMPSVVAINSTTVYTQEDWFFGKQQYEVPGSGSGIIAGQNDSELLVVTNNHVVADSEQLSVTFIDGTNIKAAVKGTDSDSDLAVVAVPLADISAETKAKIKPAILGDSDVLKLGQGVVAIGNALGQGQSVTVGYVSALNKKVNIGGVERTLLQ